METYEKHILRDEAAVKVEGVPDLMAVLRETLPDVPETPDDYSAMKIAEIEALERIREREELRPIEPETEPVTSALWHISDELSKLRVAVETLDRHLKNRKF